MSDELQQEVAAAVELSQPQETPEVQEDPTVSRARAQGWRPEEEYEGEKEKWVPADEFLRRKPLFDKIHEQGKAIKDYAKTVEHMADTLKKIEERTRREEQEKYQRQLDEIQRSRRQAIAEGDVEAVERYDEQLEKARTAKPEEAKQEQPQQRIPPDAESAVNTWVERNKWYNDPANKAMQVFMNAVQNEHLQQGMSVAEALQASERLVRQEFAHKFENPNKEKASPVLQKTQGPKSASMDMLTPEMKNAFRILQRSGMSLDEYIASQKSAGNL